MVFLGSCVLLFSLAFLLVANKYSDVGWASFAYVYFLYCLPLTLGAFEYTYFGKALTITTSIVGVLWFVALTLGLTLLSLLHVDNKHQAFDGKHFRGYSESIVANTFLALGCVALLSEVSFWGWSLVSTSTAERWSQEAQHKNLGVISVDGFLLVIGGLYSKAVRDCSGRKLRSKSALLLIAITLVAVAGLFAGQRYYVALLWVLWVFRPGFRPLPYVKRLSYLCLASPLILIVAANIESIYAYFLSWDYTKELGFWDYLARRWKMFPAEILAINTNFLVGYQSTHSEHPGVWGYLLKCLPLSEKYYSFEAYKVYYQQLAVLAGIDLRPGQGTAFSFLLESFDSLFVVPIMLAVLLALGRSFRSPTATVIVLFFTIGAVRNGFIASIAVIKIPLYLLLLVTCIAFLMRQSLKSKQDFASPKRS